MHDQLTFDKRCQGNSTNDAGPSIYMEKQKPKNLKHYMSADVPQYE